MSEKISRWLDGLGLGRYEEQFAAEEVTFEDLSELDDDDLKALGIPLGPRKRILKAVAALAQPEPANHGVLNGAAGSWERFPDERKPATILFADIAGSTALTERLDAEDAHALLDGARQRICEAVSNHRGTVCRVTGDGVMAAFGVPVASEHHAQQGCEAALEMQRSIGEYAAQLSESQGHGLKIRVGLHSGEIVALSSGRGDNVEYDADGPTVTVAARMEQSAAPGAIYITGATQNLAGPRLKSDELDPIAVKGVSAPVQVFALLGLRASDETAAGARTRFVGRRAELNQLKGVLASCAEEGYGQVVYLRGEPGIGKTRLLAEFLGIAEDMGFQSVRTFALPFGVAKGQDAIRTLVRRLLNLPHEANPDERARVAADAIEQGNVEQDHLVHLNDLLDLTQPVELKSLYDAMDGATRSKGRQAVVAKLIATASSRRPLFVVVEDIHWADSMTLEHLAALTRAVSEQPVLLTMTSRIEGDPLTRAWLSSAGNKGLTSIELGPLRRAESMQLIEEFVADDGLAEHCLERAGGNPLFLEQLLRSAGEGVTGTLPDSLQSLVLARLDQLPDGDKRALQCASVIGQRFDASLLEHLLGEADYDCSELVHHNLVRVEGAGYLFSHALIQEGVYASLLKKRRRQLHRACADYFEGADSVLCAEHLGHADDPAAGQAFLRAAEEQAAKYRYEHALSLAERGLALNNGKDTVHRLRCLKGDLLHELDDVEGSIATFREILEEAQDDAQRFDAWMGLAAGKRVMVDLEEALELVQRAESVAHRRPFDTQLSTLHHLRGNLFYGTGDIEGCRREHELALKIARESGSIEAEARALGGVADAECARGRMRSAYESFQACIDRCRDIGLGRVEVANRSQMANCFVFLGNLEDALTFSTETVAAAAQVGHIRAEINALEGVCSVGLETGNYELLAGSAERGLVKARLLQSPAWEAYYLSRLSVAYFVAGDNAKAQEMAEGSVRLGEPSRAFIGGWTLGALAMVAQDIETKTGALREADALVATGMNGEGHLHFLRYAMFACVEEAMWNDLERYAEALDTFTRDERFPWGDFFAAYGRILSRVGHGERSTAVKNEVNRLTEEAGRLGYTVPAKHLEAALL